MNYGESRRNDDDVTVRLLVGSHRFIYKLDVSTFSGGYGDTKSIYLYHLISLIGRTQKMRYNLVVAVIH